MAPGSNPNIRKIAHGFTLIELSIVLVIIGLIIGGVLVGKDLIESANMRKDISTIERITAAANTFRMKYDYLPGDLPNATNFGFDAASSGNGDGKIQGDSGYSPGSFSSMSWTYPAEWFRVFHHLGKAGMFDFDGNYNTSANSNIEAGVYYPLQATQGNGFTSEESFGHKPGIMTAYEKNNRVAGHFFRLGAMSYGPNPAGSSGISFMAGFSPVQAKRFDTKFDDGLPLTGSIQIAPISDQCADDIYASGGSCYYGGITAAATFMRCALLSTSDYDTNYAVRSCGLRIKAQY